MCVLFIESTRIQYVDRVCFFTERLIRLSVSFTNTNAWAITDGNYPFYVIIDFICH